MDENKDSDVNIIEETPSATPHRSVAMSPPRDHSATTSSSHVAKRKSISSNEAVSEPRVKRLNSTRESDLTVPTNDLSQQLKQTKEKCVKEECVQERKHLSAYSAWVDKLKEENDMKDKKSDEKDKIIGSLETECNYKNKQLTAFSEQLQENAKTIHKFELEFKNKEKQLIEKSNLIEQLRKECTDKENQLIEKANTIKELESDVESKDAQLIEKTDAIKELQLNLESKSTQLFEKEHLIDELQTKLDTLCKLQVQSDNNDQHFIDKEFSINEFKVECVEKEFSINELQMECVDKVEKSNAIDKPRPNSNGKETQPTEKKNLLKQFLKACIENIKKMETTPYCLKFLEDVNNESFSNLEVQAKKCVDRSRYVDALIILEKAIELEESTQNRSDKLTHLFSEKVFCYLELEQYEQALNAADSAFQHDPNDIIVLYNRATVYFKLKKYSKARQDLKKLLAMYPRNIYANDLLDRVQKRETSSI